MSPFLSNQPDNIHATLDYYLPPANGIPEVAYPGTAAEKLRKYDPHTVEISSMRGQQLFLDQSGFALVHHESADKDIEDADGVRGAYFAETGEMLKSETGASRVVPISHVLRKDTEASAIAAAKAGPTPETVLPHANPVMQAHIDQSYNGAVQLLEDTFPHEVAQLTKNRWAIINVWRPVRTVTRDPLAVCDAQSVEESDLLPRTLHLPKTNGKVGGIGQIAKGETFETCSVRYIPAHRWYYAPEMTPDEVLFIKCFDSKKEGRARRTPHCAFTLEHEYGPPRKSCEVRCLVFWEHEDPE